LFSSIFSLGRTLAGPPAGFLVDAIGWTPFFLVSTAASIPGLVLLQRFVPLGSREPVLEEEKPMERRPVTRGRLALTSLVAGLIGALAAMLCSALLAALKAARGKPGASVDVASALGRLLAPAAPSDWIRIAGLVVIGLLCSGAAAAFLAAKHGLRGRD
ncbi:MAG TPA: MFS transporter, partial [Thermoanaerobaculia bacterium]|nr:MFS transporter [Thermoanaerobaculia bacterium]